MRRLQQPQRVEVVAFDQQIAVRGVGRHTVGTVAEVGAMAGQHHVGIQRRIAFDSVTFPVEAQLAACQVLDEQAAKLGRAQGLQPMEQGLCRGVGHGGQISSSVGK